MSIKSEDIDIIEDENQETFETVEVEPDDCMQPSIVYVLGYEDNMDDQEVQETTIQYADPVLPVSSEVKTISKPKSSLSPWTHGNTCYLIEQYRKLHGSHTGVARRHMFNKVAAELSVQCNVTISPFMCEKKWSNLLVSYNRSLERMKKLKKLGKSPVRSTWEYFSMIHEICKDSPRKIRHIDQKSGQHISPSHKVEITPVETSPLIYMNSREEPEQKFLGNGCNLPPHVNISIAQKKAQSTHSTKEDEPPSWFREFAKQQQESELRTRQMFQNMHKELIDIATERNDMLEQLLGVVKNFAK